MNRNEQIRLVAARDGHAFTVIDVDIPVSHQDGFHAGLGIDTFREFATDLQHDVLFARTLRTDGARILAAVARVDGDHDIAPGTVAL